MTVPLFIVPVTSSSCYSWAGYKWCVVSLGLLLLLCPVDRSSVVCAVSGKFSLLFFVLFLNFLTDPVTKDQKKNILVELL